MDEFILNKIKYDENLNLMGKINTELCKSFGLEHYLTEFSSNLIRALHQYIRFLEIIDDKNEFLSVILAFSDCCIAYFNPQDNLNINEKSNDLINNMNTINEMINNSFFKSIEKYRDD